ncbi:hypothetical protein GCM10012275_39730 [Longimycelium tulufanense]|uniref:DUF7426 domain-containing protein n=1 Tax=Longimycelium tulufanense TaxID=907463 RepID=A0A8J3FXS3_9PSEU|nr:hypothetical protein [Longimycelium tulufanense]GGM65220.1 hypothetical protein GCM10012275_39730 [Longimycelium tulufanense]
MAFRDLSELLDPGLPLPINGKTYVVPPPDAQTGLRLQRLAEHAAKVAQAAESGEPLDAVALDDDDEIDLYRDALGSAYDEMLADQVPWPALKIAGITAWLDAAVSRDAAETYWHAAGNPERAAGSRATRAAARSTRRPASASGTTPRRRKAGTPGPRSSATGR